MWTNLVLSISCSLIAMQLILKNPKKKLYVYGNEKCISESCTCKSGNHI